MPSAQHASAVMPIMSTRLAWRLTPASAAYSKAAAAAMPAAMARSATSGSHTMAAKAAAARITPLTRRVIQPFSGSRSWSRGGGGCGDAAVPPLTLLIGEDGVDQVPAPEVGPQRVGDVDFGVRDLPQQVVAHPHFAARADHQIRVGLPRGVEKARERSEE